MTDLADLDVVELHAEYEMAVTSALALAGELVHAVDSGDFAWTAGLTCALKPALLRVKRLRRAIALGAAR